MEPVIDRCLTCNVNLPEAIYIVPTSNIGAKIYICPQCSLVQTRPIVAKTNSAPSSTSGAGWGGLRYGKGFAAEGAFDALRTKLINHRTILDVGAGRGYFADIANRYWQVSEYVAVEPEAGLFTGKAELHNNTIEEFLELCDKTLPIDMFDLVHCSHTLEHLIDPAKVLHGLSLITGYGGRLYVEVPNLDILPDVVEEMFIDRHVTHFTQTSLRNMLHSNGWRAIDSGVNGDAIWAICSAGGPRLTPRRSTEPFRVESMIKDYATRDRITQIRELAEKVNGLQGRTVVWGNGRIADLMRENGLNGNTVFVDRYRPGQLRPEDVKVPDNVVNASRQYRQQIYNEIRELWGAVNVI